jgi:hypothetical protein
MSLGSCDTHHVGCNMGPGADIPTVSGPGRQRRRRVSTVREHWQCAPTAISAKPLRCASRGPFRHPKLLGALTIWFTHGRWTANMRSRGGTADIVRPRAIVALWRVATGLSRVRRGHLAGSGDGTVVHQFTSTPCAVGALGPACARARTQEPRARTQELRVGTVNGRETRAEMVSLASAAEAGHNERSANLVTMPHGCERHSSAPKTPVRLNPLTF